MPGGCLRGELILTSFEFIYFSQVPKSHNEEQGGEGQEEGQGDVDGIDVVDQSVLCQGIDGEEGELKQQEKMQGEEVVPDVACCF